jgi:hypothetical protein
MATDTETFNGSGLMIDLSFLFVLVYAIAI